VFHDSDDEKTYTSESKIMTWYNKSGRRILVKDGIYLQGAMKINWILS
jgi:hypothetical protein